MAFESSSSDTRAGAVVQLANDPHARVAGNGAALQKVAGLRPVIGGPRAVGRCGEGSDVGKGGRACRR